MTSSMASSSPVLLAFGGNYANGQLNDKVYMSVDQGVHWAEAPAYMQPGSNAPLLTGFPGAGREPDSLSRGFPCRQADKLLGVSVYISVRRSIV